MRYKENWEACEKRLAAFWNQELVDRSCVSVMGLGNAAPLGTLKKLGTPEECLRYWTDPDVVIARNRARMEHTYYGGESYPGIAMYMGVSAHSAFFKNAKYTFGDTLWIYPTLEDPAELEFDEQSFIYHKTIELAKAFAEDSRGDYMIGMPDLSGNLDALQNLMGPENLLISMIEDPEGVKDALNKLEYAYERIMSELYAIVKGVNRGGSCVGWLSTWAPGLHALMQCDLSVMISNPMFKEFALPELQTESRFLDYSMYHLDGFEQTRHLDDILSVRELRAIQWTQVAGQPPCTEYLPYLKRIQAAGKSLVIVVTPEQIEPLMENLSSKGLFLVTTVQTKEEAQFIEKQVTKLTHE